MSTLEKQLEYMELAEVKAIADDFAAKYELNTDREWPWEEVKDLFVWRQAIRILEGVAQSLEFLIEIEPIIDQLKASAQDRENVLELYAKYQFSRMEFSEEVHDSFINLPFYKDVLGAFEESGLARTNRYLKTSTQLALHYRVWQGIGDVSLLSAEDRAYLEKYTEEGPANLETRLDELEEEENWEDLVDLRKASVRFYTQMKKPNDAIRGMKALLDELPMGPDFVPADLADQYMELAKLFTEYRKFEVAKKYFGEALSRYQALGEEFELFSMQAEGWIDECNKMLR